MYVRPFSRSQLYVRESCVCVCVGSKAWVGSSFGFCQVVSDTVGNHMIILHVESDVNVMILSFSKVI